SAIRTRAESKEGGKNECKELSHLGVVLDGGVEESVLAGNTATEPTHAVLRGATGEGGEELALLDRGHGAGIVHAGASGDDPAAGSRRLA
ncbi:hypothetical protein DQW25_29160, partial [Escherichia coli O111:H8]